MNLQVCADWRMALESSGPEDSVPVYQINKRMRGGRPHACRPGVSCRTCTFASPWGGRVPRSKAAAMQTAEEALLHWITAAGGYIHSSLNVMADVGGEERGIVAVKQVQEGDQLAILPMCLCLHTPTAAACTPQVEHACVAALPRESSSCFLRSHNVSGDQAVRLAQRRSAASARTSLPACSRLCGPLSQRSSCCCTSCPRYPPSAGGQRCLSGAATTCSNLFLKRRARAASTRRTWPRCPPATTACWAGRRTKRLS